MTQGNTPAADLFDALGIDYERAFAHSPAHRAALTWLVERLAPDSSVLDVGSGTGHPTARTLVDAGHRVQGVDISPRMVELARRQVPEASFRCQDSRTLELAASSVDAVCAFFSFLQMPRADQRHLVEKIARWLRPGGLFVAATVPVDVEEAPGRWMGYDVEVTSFAPVAFTDLLESAGFTVQETRETDFAPDSPIATPEPQLFVCATLR
ncbi:class I SAM-dependent methyltransferase [Streptomyces jumonjinensis]|uniref:class I SAM-dependent methyltransferase n=1 Tax=Streptomyces jumonjinensis TaxID=1945 RepID=UPI0037B099B5